MSNTLTPRQAAKRMGISLSTMYVYLTMGQLEGAYKDANGRWFIPENTVLNLRKSASARTTTSTDPNIVSTPISTRESERELKRVTALAAMEKEEARERSSTSPDSFAVDATVDEDEYAELITRGALDHERELEEAYAKELEELNSQEYSGSESDLDSGLDQDDELAEYYADSEKAREDALQDMEALEAIEAETRSLDKDAAPDDLETDAEKLEKATFHPRPWPLSSDSSSAKVVTRSGPVFWRPLHNNAPTENESTEAEDAETTRAETEPNSPKSSRKHSITELTETGKIDRKFQLEEDVDEDDDNRDVGVIGGDDGHSDVEDGDRESGNAPGRMIPMRKWASQVPLKYAAIAALLTVGLVLAYAAIDSTDVVVNARQYIATHTPIPTMTAIVRNNGLPFAPRAEGETLIVIPKFEGATDESAPHVQIKSTIAKKADELGLDNLRVEIDPSVLGAGDLTRAQELADRYQASLVIWGEDTGSEILVDLLSRTGSSAPFSEMQTANISLGGRTLIANPNEHFSMVVDDLPAYLEYISNLAMGESYFMDADYSVAAAVNEVAFNSISTDNLTPDELADANFRLGWLYQLSQTKANRALDYYNAALQYRPQDAAILNNIGIIHDSWGEKQQALNSFQQVQSLYHETGDQFGEAVASNNIAAIYDDLGDKVLAMEFYDEALALSKDIGSTLSEATVLNNMGALIRSQGDLQTALDYFDKALSLRSEVGDAVGEAVSLISIGSIHDDKGDEDMALEFFTDALNVVREMGDKANESLALDRIGSVYDDIGDKQQALAYYNQSLFIRREVGDRIGEAATLGNIGTLYNNINDPQKALDYHNQALALVREVGDKAGEAITLNNIGAVYDDLGEKQQALEYYNQALDLLTEVGDKSGIGVTLNNIGSVNDSLGNTKDALSNYNQSLALSRDVGDKLGEATTLNNIGALYRSTGNTEAALSNYSEALGLLQEMGDRMNEAVTYSNIGYVYSRLGKQQESLQNYDKALQLIREVGDTAGEAITLWNIGLVHHTFSDIDQALEYYEQALPLLQSTGNTTGQALVLSNIGAIHNATGDTQLALSYYNRVLPLTMENGDLANEAVTRYNIAMIYKDLEENDKAEEQMVRVVEIDELLGDPEISNDKKTLARLRGETGSETTTSGFRSR